MASAHETAMAERFAGRAMDEFGETVTYTPRGGVATSISAIVDRGEFAVQGANEIATYPVAISVRREDVAAVIPGGDTVTLKRRLSDSSDSTLYVAQILDDYAGCWRLALKG